MKERWNTFIASLWKREEEKNDLLQSYFTSLLSLVLCVSMFLGTSYAWFTSEVNNVGNEIYIGILDVELEKQSGEEWRSLSELTDEGVNTTKLYDGSVRWEPGYTALETIRVANRGELSFKYVLQFTDGTLPENQELTTLVQDPVLTLEDIAAFFDVWVFDHQQEQKLTSPGSFDDINEELGWVYAGTLAQLLAGEPVLQGAMEVPQTPVQMSAETEDQGASAEDIAPHIYTIALHMSENADSSVMGHKISLNVKLVAYQMAAEHDDFGGTAYDDGITVVTAPESMNEVLEKGGNVLMTVDMAIGDTGSRVTMNGGVLDGNGNTIAYNVTKEEDEPSLGVVTTTGGIVRNLTIQGGDAGWALYVTNLTSDLLVSNCTLSGAYSFNLSSNAATEYTVSFVRTTFTDWTSYANTAELVEFAYCTFEDVLRPYGDTKLVNCTIADLDLSKLEDGEAVTLINCTYDGTEGVNAVFRAVNHTIQLERENGVTETLGQQ